LAGRVRSHEHCYPRTAKPKSLPYQHGGGHLYLPISHYKLCGFPLKRGQQSDAEQALEYAKAAAQTFETLLERGNAAPEPLQQLATKHWDIAMIARQIKDGSEDFQQACARSYRLLNAMKESIPIDRNCEQILVELNMMADKDG